MSGRLKESVGFEGGSGRLDAFYSTTFRQAPHFRRSFVNMYTTIDALSLGCPPFISLWAKLDCSVIGYGEAEHSASLLGPCLTDGDASLNFGSVGFAGLCWMPLLLLGLVMGLVSWVVWVASGRFSGITDIVRSVTKTPAVCLSSVGNHPGLLLDDIWFACGQIG